jgi:Transposase and inactivated derivatives
MFLPEPSVNIWLYTQPVDMRKSFDGLIAVATRQLHEKPTSGDLFVFINKRKTHMKVLYFESSGYCLWYKRLEQGQFNYASNTTDKRLLNWASLKLLLDGIAIKKSRQYKRYCHPK